MSGDPEREESTSRLATVGKMSLAMLPIAVVLIVGGVAVVIGGAAGLIWLLKKLFHFTF